MNTTNEERPTDDLISREALKTHITEIFETEEKIDKKWAMGLKYSLKIIDLAPTVDVDMELAQKREKLYEESKKLYMLAKTLGKEERPQGEWLHKEFDPFLKEYGQCSNCLQRERVGNFCRNCGADMRKGGVE